MCDDKDVKRGSSGYLVVIILYILLAIIITGFGSCGY